MAPPTLMTTVYVYIVLSIVFVHHWWWYHPSPEFISGDGTIQSFADGTDLVVIGSGPGGYVAIKAAQLGLKVCSRDYHVTLT